MTPTHLIARRPLTDTELAAIFARIDEATTVGETLAVTIHAVYTALLDGVDRPDVGFGPGRRLNPAQFAIPDTQWRAILAVATNRAQEWGSLGALSLEFVNYLPDTYDDPTVPTPMPDLPDRRPPIHQLHLTRSAVDVIGANTRYLDQLAITYGPDAEVVRLARDSWYRRLTDLLTIPAGGHTMVRADGDRSLHVTAASGFTYGIVFHPRPLDPALSDATTPANTDPSQPGQPSTVDGADAAPVQAGPQPGVWTAHS